MVIPFGGVVNGFPFGIDVRRFTPPVQPRAGQDGQIALDLSS